VPEGKTETEKERAERNKAAAIDKEIQQKQTQKDKRGYLIIIEGIMLD
jgi:hypothetical protein